MSRWLLVLCLVACSHRTTGYHASDAGYEFGYDGGMYPGSFCGLPGSVTYEANGNATSIAGGMGPDLSWLTVPAGYCVHWYGNVGDARQLAFAPGGELFVASPTQSTTGGNAAAGEAAIMVLADDDHDGYADTNRTFLGSLPETQGLMFTPGFIYYQDGTQIMRAPYASGQRQGDASQAQLVVDVTVYTSSSHWPKPISMADDGTLYVGNGGDQGAMCVEPMPFEGGILDVDGTPGGDPIVTGMRNPIAVRCQSGHDLCFALELAEDYSGPIGGREKLVPIHTGDNWGYPCCATQNLPYTNTVAYNAQGSPIGTPDCSSVNAEQNSFNIGETPFGMDFEPWRWPPPWGGRVYIAMHGVFGSWVGARVVGIETDETTGMPLPSSDLDGGDATAMSNFATGWDDGHLDHGRPAAVTMAPDGRLFLANDVSGDIVWIAPAL